MQTCLKPNKTSLPSEFFLLFTPQQHRKIKRSANLSYSFLSKDSGQGFVSRFDRCTSRWWGTLLESSRFPGLHVQKKIFSRIMWFSEGRNTVLMSHTRTSQSFFECTRVVWKRLSSEKSWLGTISHRAQPDPHKTQICSPTAPSGKFLHGCMATTGSWMGITSCLHWVWHISPVWPLPECNEQNNTSWELSFNAHISVQPTRWGTSCQSRAGASLNVSERLLNPNTAPTLWNRASGLGVGHKKVLFWSNGAEAWRRGFVIYPTPGSMFLAAN